MSPFPAVPSRYVQRVVEQPIVDALCSGRSVTDFPYTVDQGSSNLGACLNRPPVRTEERTELASCRRVMARNRGLDSDHLPVTAGASAFQKQVPFLLALRDFIAIKTGFNW